MARTRVFKLQAGEIDDWAVGFGARLASGETLTGTPAVTVHVQTGTEAQYDGVTLSQVDQNSAPVTDADGVTHAADEAVEFRITADAAAVAASYTLRVECATSTGRSLVETFDIVLSGPPET